MARQKQKSPLKRKPSDIGDGKGISSGNDLRASNGNGAIKLSEQTNGSIKSALIPPRTQQAGLPQLIICVGGIYMSFLSWAYLQERITTTSYGPPSSPTRFTYPVFLNTIQSTFAALVGYCYLESTKAPNKPTPAVFPTSRIVPPLLLVAITSSLASPFGYASLAHIDYLTFLLAKSCKLLPVMFLHLTIFRKSYPLHKYFVVALVTSGVALFTLHHPSSAKHPKSKSSSAVEQSSAWGLLLLSVNLLFDGLTNSTQDHIFAHYAPYTGPQMMVAQNLLSTLLTSLYLLLGPHLGAVHAFLGLPAPISELSSALSFLQTHPAVLKDVLAFAACGAVGQIFIYYTLSRFSSLLLVTVTVTRKMLSMMLSVLLFGHRLSAGQWLGVGLVFGGVGAEGWVARRGKAKKG